MLKHTAFSYAGKYKTTPNEIDMVLETGEKVVLFKPLEPYETPDAVEHISIEKAIADTKETYYEVLQQADQNWHEGENDPKPFI